MKRGNNYCGAIERHFTVLRKINDGYSYITTKSKILESPLIIQDYGV